MLKVRKMRLKSSWLFFCQSVSPCSKGEYPLHPAGGGMAPASSLCGFPTLCVHPAHLDIAHSKTLEHLDLSLRLGSIHRKARQFYLFLHCFSSSHSVGSSYSTRRRSDLSRSSHDADSARIKTAPRQTEAPPVAEPCRKMHGVGKSQPVNALAAIRHHGSPRRSFPQTP
jgi:hypothetical protein